MDYSLCTQELLDDSFSDHSHDDEKEKKQVGTFSVQEDSHVGIIASEHPIYEGDNTIGRHENCDIAICSGMALSKKHACIEAEDDAAYIYDCGSSNKTRLGKMRLKPNIRYCLRDGDQLLLANIKCIFKQAEKKKLVKKESPAKTETVHPDQVSTPKIVHPPQLLALDTPESMLDQQHQGFDISDFSNVIPESQPCDQSVISNGDKSNNDGLNLQIDEGEPLLNDVSVKNPAKLNQLLLLSDSENSDNELQSVKKNTKEIFEMCEVEDNCHYDSETDVEEDTKPRTNHVVSSSPIADEDKSKDELSDAVAACDDPFAEMATLSYDDVRGEERRPAEDSFSTSETQAAGHIVPLHVAATNDKHALMDELETQDLYSSYLETLKESKEDTEAKRLSTLEEKEFNVDVKKNFQLKKKPPKQHTRLKNRKNSDDSFTTGISDLDESLPPTPEEELESHHHDPDRKKDVCSNATFVTGISDLDDSMEGSLSDTLPVDDDIHHQKHQNETLSGIQTVSLQSEMEANIDIKKDKDDYENFNPKNDNDCVIDCLNNVDLNIEAEDSKATISKKNSSAAEDLKCSDYDAKIASLISSNDTEETCKHATPENVKVTIESMETLDFATAYSNILCENVEQGSRHKEEAECTSDKDLDNSSSPNFDENHKPQDKASPEDNSDAKESSRPLEEAETQDLFTAYVQVLRESELGPPLPSHSEDNIDMENESCKEIKSPPTCDDNTVKLLESNVSTEMPSNDQDGNSSTSPCNIDSTVNENIFAKIEDNTKTVDIRKSPDDINTESLKHNDQLDCYSNLSTKSHIEESGMTTTLNGTNEDNFNLALDITTNDTFSDSNNSAVQTGDVQLLCSTPAASPAGLKAKGNCFEEVQFCDEVENDLVATQTYSKNTEDTFRSAKNSIDNNEIDIDFEPTVCVQKLNPTANSTNNREQHLTSHQATKSYQDGIVKSGTGYDTEEPRTSSANKRLVAEHITSNCITSLSQYNQHLPDSLKEDSLSEDGYDDDNQKMAFADKSEICNGTTVDDVDDAYTVAHTQAFYEGQNEDREDVKMELSIPKTTPIMKADVNYGAKTLQDAAINEEQVSTRQRRQRPGRGQNKRNSDIYEWTKTVKRRTSGLQSVANTTISNKMCNGRNSAGSSSATTANDIVVTAATVLFDSKATSMSRKNTRNTRSKVHESKAGFECTSKAITRRQKRTGKSKESQSLGENKETCSMNKGSAIVGVRRSTRKTIQNQNETVTEEVADKPNGASVARVSSKTLKKKQTSKEHFGKTVEQMASVKQEFLADENSTAVRSGSLAQNDTNVPQQEELKLSEQNQQSTEVVTRERRRAGRKRKTETIKSDDDTTAKNAPLKKIKEEVLHAAALSLRPRRLKPKVMFTGVIDKVGENIVKELGGHLTDDMHECTHLVTDKIRRTVKFLCAIVRGLRIVNQEWLRDSKKQSRFLAEDSYENFNESFNTTLSPSSAQSIEAQYGFNFTETMAVARSRPQQLFSGHRIHVTKSVLPPPHQMYQIIECGGGVCVRKMPKGLDLDDVVIVASESDKRCCTSTLKAGVPVVNSEYILTGILQQKLDVSAFRLFQSGKT
ncbi:uncharacterized protein LOC143452530 isoform X1 [Clavelina lepadiformis]|uniref:uncharacterized protein LOC143452530 isoform X1 n=2 Tax=Clavelina lepadiformis TaxID=159417 RepID=UPI0040428C76